jgi:hypothetical protein
VYKYPKLENKCYNACFKKDGKLAMQLTFITKNNNTNIEKIEGETIFYFKDAEKGLQFSGSLECFYFFVVGNYRQKWNRMFEIDNISYDGNSKPIKLRKGLYFCYSMSYPNVPELETYEREHNNPLRLIIGKDITIFLTGKKQKYTNYIKIYWILDRDKLKKLPEHKSYEDSDKKTNF